MRIKKIYNNNIILSESDNQLEHILLGRGIAFQKKAGDVVDKDKIEKTFVLDSPQLTNKFVKLLKEVPVNHLEISNKIIEDAEKYLNVKFNNSIYVALTDHINYALTRYKNGENIKNILLWEIKKFYTKEFEASLKALETIQYYEDVKLQEDEAGFIALHFVNAQQDGEEMNQTILATDTVKEIFKIVQFHYSIKIDEKSLNYSRFVTHIRYFVRRIIANELAIEDDDFLYKQIKEKYPKSFECVIKVKNYILDKFDIDITNEEMVYFMLHINRVTQREIN
jgi:beta-glucoside operon transcriptional antiterminator